MRVRKDIELQFNCKKCVIKMKNDLIFCNTCRYKKRKEKGLLKSVGDLTAKQQKKQRAKWNENSKRYKQKKKCLQAEDIETCGELVPPSLKTVQGTLKVHQVRSHLVNNQIRTIPILFHLINV